jgi:hypothetical protein
MGSFRSQPDNQKHTEQGKGVALEYVSSHMCGTPFFYIGWRIYMEDAHISVSPLTDKKNSLFAVFDGHGGILFQLIQGAEVSKFVERHFVQ